LYEEKLANYMSSHITFIALYCIQTFT